MKALGYLRVGAGSARDAGSASLVEEAKTFFRFCEEHGYEPVATFVDADTPERREPPEYLRMLDYLHRSEKGFMVVVIKSLDRLSANPQEALRYILEIESLGAKVLLIDEASTDALTAAIKAWSKKRLRKEVTEKIKSAMRAKAIRGEGLGRPAYGYRIGKDGRFQIVLEEVEVVRLIFHLYTEEKLGIRLIARHLNERGIKTRRGGNWNMITIRGVLRNRTYLGTYNRFGMRIPSSHPAIISNEVFKKIQERLVQRPQPRGYARGAPFLLASLAYCGLCGNKMIGISRRQSWTRHKDGTTARAEYRYYQCESRTNQSICSYNTRRAQELEGEVLEKLRQRYGAAIQENGLSTSEIKGSISAEESEKLRSKLKLLDKRLAKSIQQVAKGVLPVESIRTLGAGLVREQRSLERRLLKIESHDAEHSTALGAKKHLEKALKEISERWDSLSFPERRELLLEVVERVVVREDGVELSLATPH